MSLQATTNNLLPPGFADLPADFKQELLALQQLPEQELWAIATAEIAPAQWNRHQDLLYKMQTTELCPAEEQELVQLRDAVDQLVMRCSCAMVLLSGGQEETAGAISLEGLVAEIKQMPPNPANITPARGHLSKKLAQPLTEIDSEFDLEAWTAAWDRIEAAMKALSLAHEAEELREVWTFMYNHYQNQST